MSSRVRQLPRRLRNRVRRMADEAVLKSFDLELPRGRTLVLVADADARRRLPENVRVLAHGESLGVLTVLDLHDAALLPVQAEGRWDSVLLVASDRSDLRRIQPCVPRLGGVEQVAVWLTSSRVPLGLSPRPEWPALAALEARRTTSEGPGTLLRAAFTKRVSARGVIAEIAVQSAPARGSHPGLFTGHLHHLPEGGLDLGARVFETALQTLEHDLVAPMDVLVAAPGTPAAELVLPHEHHVLARTPVLVTQPGVAPVDEAVFNPIGWVKTPSRQAVDLSELVSRAGHVTEAVVRRARAHRSVRVDLASADVQDVLRLAMAGVPLEPTTPLSLDARPARLAGASAAVVEELGASSLVDLDDALEREEYALRLRRATFDTHSTLAHRAARSELADVRRQRSATAGLPGVSILLATRREHELPNAVANARKQVGAEIELVVAAHGFTVDEAAIREMLGDEHGLVALSFSAETRFGDVLTAAAQAASHDVVMKMDDDDWYSPHTVHDLLMARRFSGADLVGMPTEFVQLVQFDQTVWRREPAEAYVDHVAGGTMTISRDLLREVGWFRPVRRWVDAQLLASVAALGGTIYRTHGLGYVLVRHEEGHTWSQDPEEFRRDDQVERLFDGFRPPGQLPDGHPGGVR